MTTASEFDVLGIGVAAVDDLLYVDEYPPAEYKVHVRRRERQCGGLTGTALVAAARLGARCGYIGTLGDDELSRTVADGFAREGIDLTHAVRRPDARPCHSTIIVDQTRKTRTIFAYVDGYFGADPDRPSADVIRRTKVLLIDHHAMVGTLRAVRIAREAGVDVVADFERHPGEDSAELFAALLPLVNHLVLPERFACQLAVASTADAAVSRLWTPDRRAVVVTRGEQGCCYRDASSADRVEHLPALPIEVMDTTGCGDVFHGAYCAALAENLPLRERLLLASAAAALKATRRGGQSGIPTRSSVEAFLAKHAS
jgi:sulfofructose kinase